MQVILLETVDKLGGLGDVVKVKGGYGRNFLLPKQKALPATPANIAYYEARKSELKAKADAEWAAAEKRREDLESQAVSIRVKAGDEGKLFGSIGTRDIALAVTEVGKKLDKSEVRLPNGVIRQVGEYDISLKLHSQVSATLKVLIVPA